MKLMISIFLAVVLFVGCSDIQKSVKKSNHQPSVVAKKEDKAKAEKEKQAKLEKERIEKEKQEQERLLKEKQEQERIAKEKQEQERIEKEKQEQERLLKEKQEQERIAKAKAATSSAATKYTAPQSNVVKQNNQPAKNHNAEPVNEDIYFASCTHARMLGYSDIKVGEPGYRSALDRDNDGIACESK